ncbi:helix-turn-helix domain-containing protein [Plantactinospora sp. B24E8]|uniref:winged helix-turn-helix transcriptional regulator n=1 Tax=Plantactinospora sp. B24E8 TaxID=3153567 RepID=UPI00325E184F
MRDLLQDRDAWSMENCSIARAFEIIGTRSAVLVLREAFFGARRFDDFARRVAVGEPAVAARLKELTADGLLDRVPYQEPGQRTRYEYRLTEKGRALLPVITALRDWGDIWAAGPEGPPVRAVHRDCATPVRVRLVCDNGHDVRSDEVEIQAGPGLITTTRPA